MNLCVEGVRQEAFPAGWIQPQSALVGLEHRRTRRSRQSQSERACIQCHIKMFCAFGAETAGSLFFCPVRKGIATGLAERGDERPDHLPPLIQAFNHSLQSSTVMAVPFGWDRFGAAPKIHDVAFFGLCERRLKRFPTGHVRIHAVPGIDAAQGRVRKVPLPSIEAISLVDKAGRVFTSTRFANEDCLTAIAVAGPLV